MNSYYRISECSRSAKNTEHWKIWKGVSKLSVSYQGESMHAEASRAESCESCKSSAFPMSISHQAHEPLLLDYGVRGFVFLWMSLAWCRQSTALLWLGKDSDIHICQICFVSSVLAVNANASRFADCKVSKRLYPFKFEPSWLKNVIGQFGLKFDEMLLGRSPPVKRTSQVQSTVAPRKDM